MRAYATERRVVVTGMGCVSALGLGVKPFWTALAAGRSGIAEVEMEFSGGVKRIAATIELVAEDHFSEEQLRLLDRNVQFTLIACREALAAAGIVPRSRLAAGLAILIGNTIGGMTTLEASYHRLYSEGRRLHPFTIPRLISNAAASHAAIECGANGPVFALSSACASANHAIGEAMWLIRTGRVDAAVAGGTEACISHGCVQAWEALRVLARDTCRPFSVGRSGLVLGEGAGIVVIEEREHARARGAAILAELVGYGASSDAADMVHPSPEGAALAIVRALEDAGLPPDAIDYVNAHGSGTPLNDATETAVLKQVFGPRAARLPISATKSMHGHALGASAALELIATIAAMREGVLPPTANYLGPDPACDLDYVPNEARRQQVGTAISNSFAFGGLNAVLCVRGGPPGGMD